MQTNNEVIQLRSDQIAPGSNIRYKLLPGRIEALATKITEMGGITTPLWVEPVAEPNGDGITHILTAGNYRKAAVDLLNKKGAGLTLPCIVMQFDDDSERRRFQLSENADRENMSPIDYGMIVKEELQRGTPRIEIRKMFPRPKVQKKGEVTPASNAWINMVASFVDLPAPIKNLAQEGLLGITALYKITQAPIEKRQAVIDSVLEAKKKEDEEEEKLEKRYLEEERKVQEQKEAAAKLAKELEEAKVQLQTASAGIDEQAAANADLYKQATSAADPEAKKAAEAKLKEQEEALKAKRKAAEEAKKTVTKLESKAETAQRQALERAKKLADLRKEAAKAPQQKPITERQVDKAKADTGVTGAVPLKLGEVREVVRGLTLPGGTPKVMAIGKALEKCFSGVSTEKELMRDLAAIVGEGKAPKAPAKK